MPSEAWKALTANIDDIKRLLALHATVGGAGAGRRYGLEVLNKSAIVLITACWEAYCEDIAAEALAHIEKHARTAEVLPKELKKQLTKELKAASHELEIWKIADGGWKKYLRDRLNRLKEKRNRDFNTPKTAQIDKLFAEAIGIDKVSSRWAFPGLGSTKAAAKLDKYVTLRGEIAHRGRSLSSVKKSQVADYLYFMQKIASRTGGVVNTHVRKITSKPLW